MLCYTHNFIHEWQDLKLDFEIHILEQLFRTTIFNLLCYAKCLRRESHRKSLFSNFILLDYWSGIWTVDSCLISQNDFILLSLHMCFRAKNYFWNQRWLLILKKVLKTICHSSFLLHLGSFVQYLYIFLLCCHAMFAG